MADILTILKDRTVAEQQEEIEELKRQVADLTVYCENIHRFTVTGRHGTPVYAFTEGFIKSEDIIEKYEAGEATFQGEKPIPPHQCICEICIVFQNVNQIGESIGKGKKLFELRRGGMLLSLFDLDGNGSGTPQNNNDEVAFYSDNEGNLEGIHQIGPIHLRMSFLGKDGEPSHRERHSVRFDNVAFEFCAKKVD